MSAAKPTTLAGLVRPHLDEEAQASLDRLNDAGLELQRALEAIADDCDPRNLAIARTHLQTALMYALHALVNNNTVPGASGDA